MPFLGIHRYAGVVAHMLVAAGGNVEKGSLAAVGVSHQGHADVVVAFLGHMGQGLVQALFIGQVSGKGLEMLVAHQGLAGLLLRHHLNLAGFFTPQRYLVADNLVFNRVLERRVEHHPHLLSGNEAHLYEAFTETAVSVYTYNDGLLAGLKFRKYHSCRRFCAGRKVRAYPACRQSPFVGILKKKSYL